MAGSSVTCCSCGVKATSAKDGVSFKPFYMRVAPDSEVTISDALEEVFGRSLDPFIRKWKKANRPKNIYVPNRGPRMCKGCVFMVTECYRQRTDLLNACKGELKDRLTIHIGETTRDFSAANAVNQMEEDEEEMLENASLFKKYKEKFKLKRFEIDGNFICHDVKYVNEVDIAIASSSNMAKRTPKVIMNCEDIFPKPKPSTSQSVMYYESSSVSSSSEFMSSSESESEPSTPKSYAANGTSSKSLEQNLDIQSIRKRLEIKLATPYICKSHKCRVCSKTFPSFQKCLQHTKSHFLELPAENAKDCEGLYLTYGKLLSQHSKDRQHENPIQDFICQRCNKKGFRRKTHLCMHLISHLSPRDHNCPICRSQCKTRVELHRHILKHKFNSESANTSRKRCQTPLICKDKDHLPAPTTSETCRHQTRSATGHRPATRTSATFRTHQTRSARGHLPATRTSATFRTHQTRSATGHLPATRTSETCQTSRTRNATDHLPEELNSTLAAETGSGMPRRCPKCPVTMFTKTDLIQHYRLNHMNTTKKNALAGDSGSDDDSIDDAEVETETVQKGSYLLKPIQCSTIGCTFTCTEVRKLVQHNLDSHSAAAKMKQLKIKCEECLFTCKFRVQLRNHMKNHKAKEVIFCPSPFCELIGTWREIQTHLHKHCDHGPERQIYCFFCDRELINIGGFNKHVAICALASQHRNRNQMPPSRIAKCELCGFETEDSCEYIQHMQQHFLLPGQRQVVNRTEDPNKAVYGDPMPPLGLKALATVKYIPKDLNEYPKVSSMLKRKWPQRNLRIDEFQEESIDKLQAELEDILVRNEIRKRSLMAQLAHLDLIEVDDSVEARSSSDNLSNVEAGAIVDVQDEPAMSQSSTVVEPYSAPSLQHIQQMDQSSEMDVMPPVVQSQDTAIASFESNTSTCLSHAADIIRVFNSGNAVDFMTAERTERTSANTVVDPVRTRSRTKIASVITHTNMDVGVSSTNLLANSASTMTTVVDLPLGLCNLPENLGDSGNRRPRGRGRAVGRLSNEVNPNMPEDRFASLEFADLGVPRNDVQSSTTVDVDPLMDDRDTTRVNAVRRKRSSVCIPVKLQAHVDSFNIQSVEPVNGIYRCPISTCSYSGRSKHGLALHFNYHRKTNKCSKCDFSSSRRDYLDRHYIDNHPPELPAAVSNGQATLTVDYVQVLTCDVCWFETTSDTELVRHRQVVHSIPQVPQNDYIATNANNQINTEHNATVQVRNTEPAEPYHCSVSGCSFSVASLQELQEHIQHIHMVPNRSDGAKFSCSDCNIRFRTQYEILQHLNEFHWKESRAHEQVSSLMSVQTGNPNTGQQLRLATHADVNNTTSTSQCDDDDAPTLFEMMVDYYRKKKS